MDQYERLEALTEGRTADEQIDGCDWRGLWEDSRPDGDVPSPEEIASVTHSYSYSPEGYGSVNLAFLGRLNDGRWVTCVAWCDTSGWDCRSGSDWRIFDTRNGAVAFGLDKESRARLGLSLPKE